MSTHEHDHEEHEIEALVRELIGRLLRRRLADAEGRVPMAVIIKVLYGPGQAEEVIEQVPEVTRIDDKVVVVTELPGVAPENIRVGMTGRTLQVFAQEGGRRYHTAAPLPPCDPGSVRTRLKHGVLEIEIDASNPDPVPPG